ncbi:MAG: TAXI family TRAP transporter solute-binding subunit [Pseudomonadota bacterium]
MSVKILHRPFKEQLKTFGPAVLITVLGFIAAYQYVGPAPPDSLVIGTGQPEGAYYQIARRYREILAREGIKLELRATAGSIENVGLLESDSKAVDVAFVQGGTGGGVGAQRLQSLSSLYPEPLWVFYRREQPVKRFTDLHGRRIAVGKQGSGTRVLALQLLADNAIEQSSASLITLSNGEAAEALVQGRIDAAFFVASLESGFIRDLLQRPDIGLMSFERAQAYTRLHRFLSRVTLPEGIVNLHDNIPSDDKQLLAATTNLVVRSDIHPALVGLLLTAASEVHGVGGWFADNDEFPSPEYLDYPLNKEAHRFFKYGPSLLQRYLPFWAANLIDRLKIMLVPLFALLLPFIKFMPPVYRWRMRSRIYRWYRELNTLDQKSYQEGFDRYIDDYLAELDRIEHEVAKVSVPLSYAEELYHLRVHIALVKDSMRSMRPGAE